jgi:hypothetical protein
MSIIDFSVKHKRTYSFLGRGLSVIIWIAVLYLGLPRLIYINRFTSLIVAVIPGFLLFLFDTFIAEKKAEKEDSAEYYFMLAVRIISSIIISWLGGFAITITIFRSLFIDFTNLYKGNYVQIFMRMVEENQEVLISFIIFTFAVFIGDSLGRLLNRLSLQKVVMAEKEDTIHLQETEIHEKDEQLELSHLQQINIISSIQHELGNKLPIAKNTLSDLRGSLKRLSSFEINRKIRDRLPGEPESAIDTFGDLLNRLESNLFYSISIVDNIRGVLKADPSRFQPSRQLLKSFLLSEVPKHINTIPNLNWTISGSDIEIEFDASQMSILTSNVIENTKRHGFNSNRGPNPVIDFNIEEYNGLTTLSIKNNGSPLPKEFSLEKFVRPGVVMGPTGHSGLGGYLIGLVATNHKATLEVNEAREPYTVEIKLTFKK